MAVAGNRVRPGLKNELGRCSPEHGMVVACLYKSWYEFIGDILCVPT